MNFAQIPQDKSITVMYLVTAKADEINTVERPTFSESDARRIQQELLELYGNADIEYMTQEQVDAKIEAEL